MKAIIISGMPAAGKTTVAWILSGKLGLPVIGGGEILKEMAIDRGYKPGGESWWDTPDGIKFLKERETNPNFDKEVDSRLAEKIRKGNIVVTSYTAPWISKDGFKVWLDAGEEKRAERMAKRDGFDIKQTMHTTKIRDDENYKLYKKLYNMEFGKDKSPFDMVINTDNINAGQVAELIIKRLKELNMLDANK
ncbi:MAG: cytidylate kinase family protein [Candidatus Micrarchaeaceae archaeon]